MAATDKLHARRRRRSSFVLVEVILALTLLGIASMAFMKSFAYSLNAARKMEIVTQANFFAMQLLDEFEIFPPAEGRNTGHFGEEFANYSYDVELTYVDPEYDRDVEVPDDIEQLFAERRLHLQIYYDDGVHHPFIAAEVHTMLMGFEKFSSDSKMSYYNF